MTEINVHTNKIEIIQVPHQMFSSVEIDPECDIVSTRHITKCSVGICQWKHNGRVLTTIGRGGTQFLKMEDLA